MTALQVPTEVIELARNWIRDAVSEAKFCIVCDRDADGLASAALLVRCIDRLKGFSSVLIADRGEHPHLEALKTKIWDRKPTHVIIVDMGSRPQPLGLTVPTLIIDHHHSPDGYPPDCMTVNASQYGEPIPSSSFLTYVILRTLVDMHDLIWLALIGSVGDLGGDQHLFPELQSVLKQYGKRT